VGPFIRVSPN
jgi:hypothetical protein